MNAMDHAAPRKPRSAEVAPASWRTSADPRDGALHDQTRPAAIARQADVVLEVAGICKNFPGVQALDDISFDICRGEVHALMGENGAGKSTLMRVLAGNHRPDRGVIRHQGEVVKLRNPLQARARGILLIHQELSLVPELTVAENIYLGSLPLRRGGRVDWKRLKVQADRVLTRLACHFASDDRVGDLSIAKQQMVEIARAVAFDCNVVIFDEPTASLTDQEKEALFAAIRELKARGVGIVYISHKMHEIFEIADRISVLRDGKMRGTIVTGDTNVAELTRMMIGRALSHQFERAQCTPGRETLRVQGLRLQGLIEDVSFSVHAGEVVGLYGLIGAGRTEVAEAIFGIRQPDAGSIFWKGEEQHITCPRDAVNLGIGLVPEDRKGQGLILSMGGRDNITLAQIQKLNKAGFMRVAQEQALYAEYQEKLAISTTGPLQRVGDLSGGNQQKIVIGKWLSTQPDLLILDEPTRGIDVGSKSEIHKLIAALAESGLAVLVISSEMPEIMGISHRILALCNGRIRAEFSWQHVTEAKLLQASTPLQD